MNTKIYSEHIPLEIYLLPILGKKLILYLMKFSKNYTISEIFPPNYINNRVSFNPGWAFKNNLRKYLSDKLTREEILIIRQNLINYLDYAENKNEYIKLYEKYSKEILSENDYKNIIKIIGNHKLTDVLNKNEKKIPLNGFIRETVDIIYYEKYQAIRKSTEEINYLRDIIDILFNIVYPCRMYEKYCLN